MTLKSITAWEKKNIDKFRRFQLPPSFQKIGLGITILAFILLLANGFLWDEENYRIIGRYGLLIGLLMISISREEVEDELIINLRMQSYAFAFIAAVFLSLIQPFANYFVDSIVEGEKAIFKDNGDFIILWILLSVQVMYFQLLKRMHKC